MNTTKHPKRPWNDFGISHRMLAAVALAMAFLLSLIPKTYECTIVSSIVDKDNVIVLKSKP
jgi:hypothetical protein